MTIENAPLCDVTAFDCNMQAESPSNQTCECLLTCIEAPNCVYDLSGVKGKRGCALSVNERLS